MSEKTLKAQNRATLFAILASYMVAFAFLSFGANLVVDTLSLQESLVSGLLPAGVGLALVGVVNAQLDWLRKAKIVFLRLKNPLPGFRAFTEWIDKDPRIDKQLLLSKLGSFPTDEIEQNRAWLRLFRQHEKHPAVEDSNRSYLLFRDAFVLVLLFCPVFLSMGLVVAEMKLQFAGWFSLTSLVYLFLLNRAARTSAVRLVQNVMSVASTNPSASADSE